MSKKKNNKTPPHHQLQRSVGGRREPLIITAVFSRQVLKSKREIGKKYGNIPVIATKKAIGLFKL